MASSQYQAFPQQQQQQGPFGVLPQRPPVVYETLPPQQTIQYETLPSDASAAASESASFESQPFLSAQPMPVYTSSDIARQGSGASALQEDRCGRKKKMVWILFFIFSLVVFGAALAAEIILVTNDSFKTTTSYILIALASLALVASILTGIAAFRSEQGKEKQKYE